MGAGLSRVDGAGAGAAAPAVGEGAEAARTETTYYQWAADSVTSGAGKVDSALCEVPSSIIGAFSKAANAVIDFFASVKTYIYEATCYTPEGTVGKADEARWAMTSSCATPTSQSIAFEKLTLLAAQEGEEADVVNAAIAKAATAFVATNSDVVAALKTEINRLAAERQLEGREEEGYAADQITGHTNTELVQNAVANLVAADPAAQLIKAEAAIKAINAEERETVQAALTAYHNALTVEGADNAKLQAMFFTLSEDVRAKVVEKAHPLTAENLTNDAANVANFGEDSFKDAVAAEARA